MSEKILLVCNRLHWCDMAREFITSNFDDVLSVFWNTGEPYPSIIDSWSGDWILSFRGDLILSPHIIKRAKKGAINFHPSTPQYRGIGSHHYAIYNNDPRFGVVCHHINEAIDQGSIIDTLYFDIAENETATSLGLRVGAYTLVMFYDFVTRYLIGGEKIPEGNGEVWGKKLYTNNSLKEWKASIEKSSPGHRCLR